LEEHREGSKAEGPQIGLELVVGITDNAEVELAIEKREIRMQIVEPERTGTRGKTGERGTVGR
jgi:hypothetical protein